MALKLGGKPVTEEHYQERLKVCRRCQYWGSVLIELPIKGIKLPGCKICGCPMATKPRWLTYWSLLEFKFKEATCPHPDGNKWREVDNDFLT